MKKILVIGDIHGRNVWKGFADIKMLLYAEPEAAGYGGFEPEFFKYVFLGDYTDSFTETSVTIKQNLLDIINFKKLYPDNVILLLGNHDVQYLLNEPWKKVDKYYCSGYRPEAHFDLYDVFNNNKDLFQFAYQINNNLFTHAGVHFGWYHYVFTKAIKGMGLNDLNIADQLNEAFKYRLDCLFHVDWYRGGTNKVGGPLWVDKTLISKKPLKYTHQFVGHNPVDEITTITTFNKGFAKKDTTSITFCDVLHNINEFYILEV